MTTTRHEKYRVPEALVCHLCGWSTPEIFETAVQCLRVMNLCALKEVRFENSMDQSDLRLLAHQLDTQGALEHYVQSVVVAQEEFEGEDVQALRTKILEDYKDSVFADKHEKEPPIRGPFGEATIQLMPGVTPYKNRPYRMQGERYEAWKSLIDKLEEDGKIEDGVGPWSSPSFPIPTKTPGKWRLVDDFRRLNAATIGDGHPMPLIEDILNRQGKCVIWTVLDMKDGYHQVPLRKEDRPYTCMSTPRGTKQWKVLVMGLKNGGAIFQRLMEWILKPCDAADPYIDDVIIGSQGNTREEALANHDRDLRHALDQCKEHRMLVNPRKAKLFMKKVVFCGHVLSEGRRTPEPGKLLSIQKMELPRTVTDLRGFLGLTNYYSCYVDHYATYAGPLQSKLQLNRIDGKKGSKKALSWTKPEIEAFEQLKTELSKSLELFILDPDAPYVLRCDASDRAIGAVLEQDRIVPPNTAPQRVPVGFFSRKLAKAQLNWTPREKETYAVVSALKMGRMDRSTTCHRHHRPQVPRGLGCRKNGHPLRAGWPTGTMARNPVKIRPNSPIHTREGQHRGRRHVAICIPGLQSFPRCQLAWKRGSPGRNEANHPTGVGRGSNCRINPFWESTVPDTVSVHSGHHIDHKASPTSTRKNLQHRDSAASSPDRQPVRLQHRLLCPKHRFSQFVVFATSPHQHVRQRFHHPVRFLESRVRGGSRGEFRD